MLRLPAQVVVVVLLLLLLATLSEQRKAPRGVTHRTTPPRAL